MFVDSHCLSECDCHRVLRVFWSVGVTSERGMTRGTSTQKVVCCTFTLCQCHQAVPVSPGGHPRPGLRRATQRLHKLAAYAPYGPDSPSNFPPSAGPALTHRRKVTVSSAWLVKIQMTLWETTMIVAIAGVTWWDQSLNMCAQRGIRPIRLVLYQQIPAMMYKHRKTKISSQWTQSSSLDQNLWLLVHCTAVWLLCSQRISYSEVCYGNKKCDIRLTRPSHYKCIKFTSFIFTSNNRSKDQHEQIFTVPTCCWDRWRNKSAVHGPTPTVSLPTEKSWIKRR